MQPVTPRSSGRKDEKLAAFAQKIRPGAVFSLHKAVGKSIANKRGADSKDEKSKKSVSFAGEAPAGKGLKRKRGGEGEAYARRGGR